VRRRFIIDLDDCHRCEDEWEDEPRRGRLRDLLERDRIWRKRKFKVRAFF